MSSNILPLKFVPVGTWKVDVASFTMTVPISVVSVLTVIDVEAVRAVVRGIIEPFIVKLPLMVLEARTVRPDTDKAVEEARPKVVLPVTPAVPATEKLPEAKRSVAVSTVVEAVVMVVLPVWLDVPAIDRLPEAKRSVAVRTVVEAVVRVVLPVTPSVPENEGETGNLNVIVFDEVAKSKTEPILLVAIIKLFETTPAIVVVELLVTPAHPVQVPLTVRFVKYPPATAFVEVPIVEEALTGTMEVPTYLKILAGAT